MKLPTNVPIEKMPLRKVGEMLGQYFLMTCKVDGRRYPTDSINNMFMSFGRILSHDQANQIIRIDV